METSKSNIINQIAQELDCGNDCYYNNKTHEVIGIPIKNHIWDDTEYQEAFGTELKKINSQKKDFIKFEALEGFESFKVMEQFVEQLPNHNLKKELEAILNTPLKVRIADPYGSVSK